MFKMTVAKMIGYETYYDWEARYGRKDNDSGK